MIYFLFILNILLAFGLFVFAHRGIHFYSVATKDVELKTMKITVWTLFMALVISSAVSSYCLVYNESNNVSSHTQNIPQSETYSGTAKAH